MNLKAEANFPFSVMAILLMYFQDLQKNDFDEYNYKKCNRGLFLSYKLKKYDSFYKNIESEIFFGMKNFYVQQPQALYSNFDMLFIVIFYEDRYILYVYILKKHFLMIVDFLDRDLSTINEEDLHEIGKLIFQKEFGLKCEQIFFYDKNLLNFYSDFGLYISMFIYKLIKKTHIENIENIRLKQNEKDLFKKCLLWLILKFSKQQPQKVYYYDFKVGSQPDIQEYRPVKPTKIKENEHKKKIRKKSITTIKLVESDSKFTDTESKFSSKFSFEIGENHVNLVNYPNFLK